jgi:hypothetical protein
MSRADRAALLEDTLNLWAHYGPRPPSVIGHPSSGRRDQPNRTSNAPKRTSRPARLPLSGDRLPDASQLLATLVRTLHVPVLAVVDSAELTLLGLLDVDVTLTLAPTDDPAEVQVTVAERDFGAIGSAYLGPDLLHARILDVGAAPVAGAAGDGSAPSIGTAVERALAEAVWIRRWRSEGRKRALRPLQPPPYDTQWPSRTPSVPGRASSAWFRFRASNACYIGLATVQSSQSPSVSVPRRNCETTSTSASRHRGAAL